MKTGSKIFVNLKNKDSADLAFVYPLTVTEKNIADGYFKVNVPDLTDEQILALSGKDNLSDAEKKELLDSVNNEVWFDWWIVESE